MKELKKISLKKQDFEVLNQNSMNNLLGGERTSLFCKLGSKIWACLQLETNCPNGFTTGKCGALNIGCPKDFTTQPF